MPASPPRYNPNGSNVELRHVLCEEWGTRCYWCTRPKEWRDLAIDHIVPQKPPHDDLQELLAGLGLPTDFDIHAVRNLAPICGSCNNMKKNLVLLEIPMVASQLVTAGKKAPEIERRFERLGQDTQIAAALLTAANADLDSPEVRAVFEEVAPAVVRRVAELGPEWLEQVTAQLVVVDVEVRDKWVFVDVNLGASSQAVSRILTQVSGETLGHALAMPVDDLIGRVAAAVEGFLPGQDDDLGAPVVGSVEVDIHSLVIDQIALNVIQAGEFTFEFTGSFNMSASASIARSDVTGSDLEYVQGDATAVGRFLFELVWDACSEAPEFIFDQAWIDDDVSEFDAWTA